MSLTWRAPADGSLISQALGTHNGLIFVLDFAGQVIHRYRPHSATINHLTIDDHSEFVASASIDGQSLTLMPSLSCSSKR